MSIHGFMTGRGHPSPLLATIYLCLAGIVSAGIWRLELEWHGWGGLDWIGYFHWAVPIGMGLFVLWVGIFCGVRPLWKRILLVTTWISYLFIVWYAFCCAVNYHWMGPIRATLLLWELGEDKMELYGKAIYAVYAAIPIGACLLAHIWSLRVTVLRWALCVGVFLSACPVAMALLYVTGHIGGPDEIHTIKSGFIIPLLIVGLGIPFIPRKKQACTEKGSAGVSLPGPPGH